MMQEVLTKEGYAVSRAYSGTEAVHFLSQHKPDLILLDLMLPGLSGEQVLAKIQGIPVIVVSAKLDVDDKVNVLLGGAVDYITKPFMPKELIFRLNAVLRRCYKEDSPLIELRDCKIDLANAQVIWEDKILPLTAKEHDILEALVRNANHIVTIDALCEAVWGDNPFGYGNSLLAHIRRIREKIEITPSKPKSLITVKGLGYKINVESRL